MVKYTKKGTKKYVKKSYRKNARKSTYSGGKTKSLVALIKKVSLKQSETKNAHLVSENNNIFHNVANFKYNLLNTTQGVSDTDGTTNSIANRLGDEVIARGLAIKIWVANKLDRPNVMYRLVVFRHQAQNTSPNANAVFRGANGNLMMDDLNKDIITPIYQRMFNLQMGFSAYATGVGGDQDGREAHRYISFYVPLKNKKIKYNDTDSTPKFSNISFCIVAYDSYGTLTTDNIASYAFQYKFYFKDP